MKKIIILFLILIISNSCKENLDIPEQLESDFPITFENVRITKESDNYYIEFDGTITNNTEHFLDELYLSPEIVFFNTTGSGGEVKLDEFSMLNNGEVFKKNTTLNFHKKLPFGVFNTDELKYEFDKVYLGIYLKGKNSTGYIIGADMNGLNDITGYTGFPAIKFDILDEWNKIVEQ